MSNPEALRIDFDSPLTQALFDRTEAQRKEHAQLTLAYMRENPADKANASKMADRQMYERFLVDCAALVETEAILLEAEALERGVMNCDPAEIKAAATATVIDQLGLLDRSVGYPMIEREELVQG